MCGTWPGLVNDMGPRLGGRHSSTLTMSHPHGLPPLYPGIEVPGAVMALNAGRWGIETLVWLPDQHTLVFADALTGREGALRNLVYAMG